MFPSVFMFYYCKSVWGVNVKMCPSQSYSWEIGSEPSNEFIAYRKGLENLLSSASPFAVPFDMGDQADTLMSSAQSDSLQKP